MMIDGELASVRSDHGELTHHRIRFYPKVWSTFDSVEKCTKPKFCVGCEYKHQRCDKVGRMPAVVEQFPAERIKRIPVNLPFERLPTCAHDPGCGEFVCTKCPEIDRLTDEVCRVEAGQPGPQRETMRAMIEWIVGLGYEIRKK